ncbi:hypothetical protein B0H63DRAFT_387322 [Podospora didyma]|uniref:DUF3669 domain-containing protein n=1 Tax=Podospora didyma TaxID=330526 RepID=A0AAE0P3X3_9PEZI|nr:hypothetical protein B0H63DRAFT_387322 [Podospora didyma]
MIGHGSGGKTTVWADLGPSETQSLVGLVLKRAPDAWSATSESWTHAHVVSLSQSFSKDGFRVNIPFQAGLLYPDDSEYPKYLPNLPSGKSVWADILPRLPPGVQTPCWALQNERIMPIPYLARRMLLEKFWHGGHPREINSILDRRQNDHCLIRPLLGSRRPNPPGGARDYRPANVISLRDYALRVDQMEALDLPTAEYACAMAEMLAFLVWVARIDAGGVKFVLARQRSLASSHSHSQTRALGSCPLAMWVLDFGRCQHLNFYDEEGREETVKLVAETVLGRNQNDSSSSFSFYPKPHSRVPEDERLWRVFKDRFLQASYVALFHAEEEIMKQLPGRVVARIEGRIRDQQHRG